MVSRSSRPQKIAQADTLPDQPEPQTDNPIALNIKPVEAAMRLRLTEIWRRTVFPVILILMVLPAYAQAPEAPPNTAPSLLLKEIGEKHGWRELRFNVHTNSHPFWCGSSRTLVLGGGEGVGIRLLDLDSGQIQILTKVVQHNIPSCSTDGRYVFFNHQVDLSKTTLWVYDRKTQVATQLYSFDFHFFYGGGIRSPLSPSGQYLIAPSHVSGFLHLPEGKVVQTVPVEKPTYDEAKLSSEGSFTAFAWSTDSRFLFLFENSTQLLVIRDLVNNQARRIRLHAKEVFLTRSPYPTPDGAEMFWWATDDEHAYLYVMSVAEPDKPPELVIEKIDDFDLFPTGDVLYGRRRASHLELLVRRKNGSESLVWDTPSHVSKKWGIPSIGPRISPDGEGIIFRYIDETDEVGYIVLLKGRSLR